MLIPSRNRQVHQHSDGREQTPVTTEDRVRLRAQGYQPKPQSGPARRQRSQPAQHHEQQEQTS